MKRALVLAGGGARGSYQVGMLRELVINQGLDFEVIRGVSVGALNAAFLAQAPMAGDSQAELQRKVEDLEDLWLSAIEGNHSVYANRGGFAGVVAGADSLYSLKPLRRLIDANVDLGALRASKRDFAVGTVSLVSGKYHEWKPADGYFIEKLVASASIPVVFPFVDLKRAKEALVDGGVRNITPLSSAFKAEPDEIYVLLTSRMLRTGPDLPDSTVQEHSYSQWDDNTLGTKVSGLDVLERTVGVLTDEIYLDDIRGALDWNRVARAVAEVTGTAAGCDLPPEVGQAIDALGEALRDLKKRPVPLNVLAPQEWFGEKNESTEFSPELIREAIAHGQWVAADRSRWVWP
ncbi:MAG: patatin-like phospholipase family protein [Planctomycetota bacterium]